VLFLVLFTVWLPLKSADRTTTKIVFLHFTHARMQPDNGRHRENLKTLQASSSFGPLDKILQCMQVTNDFVK